MMEETKLWLNQAKSDLRKARSNIKIKNYDLASFLSQQAAEKSLKSLLIEKTKTFPKIHDLVRLGKLLNMEDELLKECEILNPVYIETRYPVSTTRYTKEEAESDIRRAQKVLKWVKKRL